MATYTVTFHQRIADYAVVQTLEQVDIQVGQTFDLSGLGHGLNGTHVVYAIPAYLYAGVDSEGDLLFDGDVHIPNQILFYDVGDDLERSSTLSTGTLTFDPTCTWVTGPEIATYLNITPTAGDTTYLVQCAAAANAYAYRRRIEAGYVDSLTTVPGQDVKLGTLMIGSSYFRQRSAFNTIATYDQLGIPTTGLSPMVLQLLGISKPLVF